MRQQSYTSCVCPLDGTVMKANPPGRRMRASSLKDAQKNGMCSKTWPETTTSTLLARNGIL
jgi:hypothetical protein